MFCVGPQLEIVRFLVEGRADVNAQDKFKHTCLNDAVQHKYELVTARTTLMILQ